MGCDYVGSDQASWSELPGLGWGLEEGEAGPFTPLPLRDRERVGSAGEGLLSKTKSEEHVTFTALQGGSTYPQGAQVTFQHCSRDLLQSRNREWKSTYGPHLPASLVPSRELEQEQSLLPHGADEALGEH